MALITAALGLPTDLSFPLVPLAGVVVAAIAGDLTMAQASFDRYGPKTVLLAIVILSVVAVSALPIGVELVRARRATGSAIGSETAARPSEPPSPRTG